MPCVTCTPCREASRVYGSTYPENYVYPDAMSDHDDHHQHDHDHSELSETELRVRALESILTEKGYVDPASLDLLIDLYEKKIGPRNGIRVVAKAWSDPAYRERLIKDATSAIAELDYSGRQGEHMVV